VSFLKEEEDCEERIRKKREKEIDRERDEGKEKRMREKEREREVVTSRQFGPSSKRCCSGYGY
jgi:hypothetical protein